MENAALVESSNFSFLMRIPGISVGDSDLASTTFLDLKLLDTAEWGKKKKTRKMSGKVNNIVIIFHLIREPNSRLIRTEKAFKHERLMGRPRGKRRTCWRHVPRPVR